MRASLLISRLPFIPWGIAFAAFAAALPGCKVGPNYNAPTAPVEQEWSSTEEEGLGAAVTTTAEARPDLSRWWERLNDPVLTGLIEQAFDSNLDVQLADARLREAVFLRRGSVADLFPAIGLDSSYTRERASLNRAGGDNDNPSLTLSQSASNQAGLRTPTANVRFGNTSVSIVPPVPGSGETADISATSSRTFGGGRANRVSNFYETTLGATWEIDIWGGIRRAIEAADAEVLASAADRRGVLVSVSAETARNYILLRGLQRRLEITHDNIAIQRETVESIQSRFAASLATGTDVLQAQTQLRLTESELPSLEAGIRSAIYRLSVLLGEPPDALVAELAEPGPLPDGPDIVAIGLPSELLRRRPDIQAAERRLAAETARIGVEVTELFPRVSLTGSFGLQARDAERYAERDSIAWSFGPLVQWRLFEFGRVLSAINVQEEKQRQAVILYKQTVLNALEQVESAIASYASERRRADALDGVNNVNTRAVELAKSEYAVGMLNFLSVLDTQRSLFSTQTDLIQSRQQTLIELVNVYEALGGGWPEELDMARPMHAADAITSEPYRLD